MDFYYIDDKYIKYLQDYEEKHRGLTKVPNIQYKDRNKFSFGAVLEINNTAYYVALSSFTESQEANILIKVPGDQVEIKGSLRFNYMIPVPDSCLKRLIINDIQDENYRSLVYKEYVFCMNNSDKILKKAQKIYQMVTENRKQKLTDNSCDFLLLEKGCREYEKQNNGVK